MENHTSEAIDLAHRVLRHDLRAIALLTALLFGAMAGLWILETRTGVLAALASRGA